jgi:hypothetical protein
LNIEKTEEPFLGWGIDDIDDIELQRVTEMKYIINKSAKKANIIGRLSNKLKRKYVKNLKNNTYQKKKTKAIKTTRNNIFKFLRSKINKIKIIRINHRFQNFQKSIYIKKTSMFVCPLCVHKLLIRL